MGEGLPRTFGRYLLFDHIGRGGMADIYLASARAGFGAERLVVVKEILPELSEDAGFARMLSAEAKLAAQLNHANVVQVTDLGREEGRLYIAMEYVEGFDLNQLLRRVSKARIGLPAEFAIFIVRETLRGLDYAHRARTHDGRRMEVVHRDVSPSNVLISFEGEVKLCDFGIARAYGLSADEHATDEGRVARARVAGKSAYMAPEHARGEEIDARADLFAAGILLWELCAGRRLFKGSEEEMLALARRGRVPPLPDRGLPDQPRLQAILDRAFEVDRLKRWQTAADFLAALEEYAMANRLMASPLRFGEFLTEHFADEIVHVRRARELAAKGELDPGQEPEPVPAVDGSHVRAKPERSVEALQVPEADGPPTVDEAPTPEDTQRTSPPAHEQAEDEPELGVPWLAVSIGLVIGAAATMAGLYLF